MIKVVKIDGSLKSALDWTEERQAARGQKGYKIFWELSLGLFSELKYPISNGTQFHSLKLSIQHFIDFLWKEFQDNSIGVCLYRGYADFSKDFKWDDKQEKNYQAWLSDRNLEGDHHRSLTYLTTEWHGLDYLIVDPGLLSSQGFRKLQGFCAAGGTIISLGKIMGLPYEILFGEWNFIKY